jgi:hypothetical protein
MIHLDGPWFKDESGRTLFLRGVNLGGSSKVPMIPDGATFKSEGFFDHRNVSFVGRPFPLEEADEHFSRLRAWGFNTLRLLVTWEAVEHAGPGIYDQDYLAYLHAVVDRANKYGFWVFIDPHEDTWSRFSGGDGAPGWTFESVGMDVTKFRATGAAITHQMHGDPFPRMIWPTNNSKFASATMFTLFFAGNDFAPQTLIEGVPAQEYLQAHFIRSMAQVAEVVKDLPNVIGFSTLNEPSAGYIGVQDLNAHFGELQHGTSPTPWQSMLLAAGRPQQVDVLNRTVIGTRKIGKELVNPEGISVWLPGCKDIWQENGLWKINSEGEPELLRPDHFSRINGSSFDMLQRHYLPFLLGYAQEIRRVNPEFLIFIGNIPISKPPYIDPAQLDRIVFEDHWYDGLTLFTKRYTSWLGYDSLKDWVVLGPKAIQNAFNRALLAPKILAKERLHNAPVLMGETGIPFDLSNKKAYSTGDFTEQERAFDRVMRAIEANLLGYTLWNYTADNTNLHGDLWNDEDLSVFSRDQQSDPSDINSGGRALRAIVRPFPICTPGTPISIQFDYRSGDFEYQYNTDEASEGAAEFFVPAMHYANGVTVTASNGRIEMDLAHQRVIHTPQKPGKVTVRFKKRL